MLTKTEIHVVIEAGALRDALNTVKHAVCREQTRYYLVGVYLHYYDGALHFVATDGHRLALAKVPAGEEYANMPGVILPPNFVAAVCKAIPRRRAWQQSSLIVTPSKVTFLPPGEDATPIECTPVDGTFPDYMRVIPSLDMVPEHGMIRAKTEDLKEAVACVTAYREAVEDHVPAVKLEIVGDTVTVSAKASGNRNVDFRGACAVAPLAREKLAPVCPAVGFNGRYLLDILKAAKVADIEFRFYDVGGPNVFTVPLNPNVLFVLMPCRV